MISDKDSDSMSECGSVGSTPLVSMDDSDGPEEEQVEYLLLWMSFCVLGV